MGAATSVMFYGAYKPLLKDSIAAILLDSPFTSFKGLADEYTKSKINIPQLLLSPAISYIKRIVEQKYDFDLTHMSPVSSASEVDVMTVVLSGREDKIVPPHLSHELYAHLTGPKLRIFFEGGHNSHRPPEIIDAIQHLVMGAVNDVNRSDIIANLIETLDPSRGSSPSSQQTGQAPSAAPVAPPGHRRVVSESDSSTGAQEEPSSTRISARRDLVGTDVMQALCICTTPMTPEEKEQEAEKLAVETQEALTNLLKIKSISSLTPRDIDNAFGKSCA